MRLFLSPSGTSPSRMRWARPSTMAVLPTPGSPMSTGLFLVRRCRTWTVRRISSSRPITGSSLPDSARAVRSTVYRSSASRFASAFASRMDSPPRADSMAAANRAASKPAARRASPALPGLAPRTASTTSADMNSSPRRCASRSARFRILARSGAMPTSPVGRAIRGRSLIRRPTSVAKAWASTPATPSKAAPPPSSSSAESRCRGSTVAWSRPTASDWASPSAVCRRVVIRSFRILVVQLPIVAY